MPTYYCNLYLIALKNLSKKEHELDALDFFVSAVYHLQLFHAQKNIYIKFNLQSVLLGNNKPECCKVYKES